MTEEDVKYGPSTSTLTWDYLAKAIKDFTEYVTLVGQCWLWHGPKVISYKRKDGAWRTARPATLSYGHAFPDLQAYRTRTLTRVCGSDPCINPDHLTDNLWGFREDLAFLLDLYMDPLEIPGRLGLTHEELISRGSRARNKHERALVAEYQRRVDTSDTLTRNEALSVCAAASRYLKRQLGIKHTGSFGGKVRAA